MSYRFALIGCGRIASRHAEQMGAFGNLAAVCDIVENRAKSLASQYGSLAFSDFRQLLQETSADIVTICTPNGFHPEHAIMALEHGSHVLCEKPMALSIADGKRMIAAAAQSGKKLFVVKQNRYNPPVIALKKLLDEGKLGKIVSFQLNCFWNRPAVYYQESWRGTKNLDGGILFTQFSHFIDLLCWFLGNIKTVSGYRANYLHQGIIDFEDTGVASIVMENGVLGSIHYSINSYRKNMEGSFTLFGEKGTVKIGGQYLNEIDYFSVDQTESPSLETGNPANQYGFYEGSMSNHHRVYQEMAKALKDPAYAFIEASEALKSVEAIEKIYASSPFVF